MKRFERSAIWTVVGVIVLFSSAILVTLLAPSHIDPSWTQNASSYQKQMHEIVDPNIYISTSNPERATLQYVYHLREGITLQAFVESSLVRILSPESLEEYVTRLDANRIRLTTRPLLLRSPRDRTEEKQLQRKLRSEWKGEGEAPHYLIYELFDPQKEEVFAITESDALIDPFTKEFDLVGTAPSYVSDEGAVFVKNPREYRVKKERFKGRTYMLYDENGAPIESLAALQKGEAQFLSRQELIDLGEDLYRVEGCWYCHTDQTRTLVQDVVLNGSASYPAPPSSANEYVYQRVTFPGTRRIGPDLSRVGIKRPHRDWHLSHFWHPQTESKGSVMPSFRHFFDGDPAGQLQAPYGIPNYQFEAIYQYLMTKGTRITPPSQAWWLGLDPTNTIDLIEGPN